MAYPKWADFKDDHSHTVLMLICELTATTIKMLRILSRLCKLHIMHPKLRRLLLSVIQSSVNIMTILCRARSTRVNTEFEIDSGTHFFLCRDVGDVMTTLYETDPPPVILIGHSMGGAIAVHAASANYIPSLIGLAVIDVVEGTALDALASMQSFLRGRPTNFKSLEHAIEWW